jgi:transcriptional regulator with XRE-family HTH domain
MSTPLRRTRIKKGLTLLNLSGPLGIDPGNLSRIERGIQAASPELAEKISKYFENEITELEVLYPERYPEKQEKVA